MQSINMACRARGGKYSTYRCKEVSWDDTSRGTVGGKLSCWGSNITDTRLKSRDGQPLFTLRSDNWNERLGQVASREVALIVGSHVAGGGALAPVTLRDFLRSAGSFGKYAGLPAKVDLSNETLDAKCSIRFQTTFLPVSDDCGSMHFATEAYNYCTLSDDDPRNLVLLCTSQGVAVQQDGAGAKRLFHHGVDEASLIHRYWLEAERSRHRVGGAQQETEEERADALQRGKATASIIGTRGMGTRFNVLMTIQVPLRQKPKPPPAGAGKLEQLLWLVGLGALRTVAETKPEPFYYCETKKRWRERGAESMSDESLLPPPPRSRAHAARVSRGCEFDVWPGLSVAAPKRHRSDHVTITVVLYNTITGSVPTEEDVVAAIDDLEDLYASCGQHGRLDDTAFDFMKKELTTQDMTAIALKLFTQPYGLLATGAQQARSSVGRGAAAISGIRRWASSIGRTCLRRLCPGRELRAQRSADGAQVRSEAWI